MKSRVALGMLALLTACAPQPPGSSATPVAPPARTRPEPGPPAATRETPAAGYLPAIDRTLAFMAKLRELPATERVRGAQIGRDALLVKLREVVRNETQRDLVQGNTELLFALDLVGAKFDLIADEIELFTSQIAGFYDPAEKQMYLLADLSEETRQQTLWHELVHALQDQHYDLKKLVKWSADGSDRVSAVQCLSEGDATSAMLDAMLAPQGKRATDMPSSLLQQGALLIEGSASLAHIPAILKRSAIAPYADGLEFTHHLRRAGGWAK
ncbi:MAG TPA: hypothetical protein VGP93_19255, partial [Polyangiaceae bacterium]|nr:hypothetical protein [Polyangiaceae bacterium]